MSNEHDRDLQLRAEAAEAKVVEVERERDELFAKVAQLREARQQIALLEQAKAAWIREADKSRTQLAALQRENADLAAKVAELEKSVKSGFAVFQKEHEARVVAEDGARAAESALAAERQKVADLKGERDAYKASVDFNNSLNKGFYEAQLFAERQHRERLEAALGMARPYVEPFTTRTFGAGYGEEIRESAKARLAVIDAALAQSQPAPEHCKKNDPVFLADFQREDRYLVLKRKDIDAALTREARHHLFYLANLVHGYRKTADKAALKCVVVESDWPEYEPTWKAIEARMTAPTVVKAAEPSAERGEAEKLGYTQAELDEGFARYQAAVREHYNAITGRDWDTDQRKRAAQKGAE